MSKTRNFVITWNNWTEESEKTLCALDVKYLYYGREVAPTTGTPHLQGYLCMLSPTTESSMKKKLIGCWVEAMKGSFESNDVYCSKSGDVFEMGIKPVSQKRKGEMEKDRYNSAYEAAKRGDFDSIDKEIMIKHLGNLKKIAAMHQEVKPCLEGALVNEWWWGPPRTGKTHKIRTENPGAYLKSLTKWWDGYTDQDVVIIDDMDSFHKSLAQDFKQWAHHYSFPAETKGGSIVIRPKKIIVTSNQSIKEVWDDPITQEAIGARFKSIHVVGNLYNKKDFENQTIEKESVRGDECKTYKKPNLEYQNN